MIDKDLIAAKAGAVKKHIDRVLYKSHISLDAFQRDADSQDILLFNLQMAIQNCIDIAAHIISAEGFGVPGSNNEMFYMLEEKGFIDKDVAEKMIKAVGFRNLVVHAYGKLDMQAVFAIARRDVNDLNDYLKAIFSKLGF